MKAAFGLCAVLFVVTIAQTTAQKYRYAVSPLDGSEQFYLQVKNSRSFERRAEEETQEIKTQICAAILGSTLFRTRHQCETALDPKAILDELRANTKYSRLYKQANSSGNPYISQAMVITGRMVEERTFYCLGRERGSRNIIQYHVSSEYVLEQKWSRKIMGRFIFLSEKVIALAEEPADIQETSPLEVERNFWNTIHVVSNTKWTSDNVMCKLSSFQKVRLCNTILNADGYRGQLEFVPEVKNIEPQCLLRKLSFDHEEVVERDKDASVPNAYKPVGPVFEWMVPCKVTNVKTQQSTMRYVLRGSRNHDNTRYFVAMMGGDESITCLESIIGEKKQSERTTEAQKQKESEEDDEETQQHFYSSGGRGSQGGGRGGQGGGGAEDIFSFFFS